MNHNFAMIETIIKERRTVKAANMNGAAIPDTVVNNILQLADYAPTHGRTEPWRFYIYTGSSLRQFCADHAALYWENTAEEDRKQQTFDNLAHAGDKVSHLVVAAMKRTANTKIPVMEELAATAAAIQNILLGAEAMGIAAIWNTGGMALKEPMKRYLALNTDDQVMGLIYLGYTDQEKKEAVRNIPFSEKIHWK